MEAGGSKDHPPGPPPWDPTQFTLKIKDLRKLPSEPVWSDCFESGICTWRLRVYPLGTSGPDGIGKGTHVSVFLEAQDVMWRPSAEYKFTLVNQANPSKSITKGAKNKFNADGER
ncbi:hypothetical protein FOA52_002308 [Chlamydomonas sp. UWO 241]|nr:hypothetical protein FOA52_002308 [Chlamydomonas sp. UWO 241]